MPTRQILQSDWRGFLDRFSERHQGWLVTVEVLSLDIGAQVEARTLPLMGINVDQKAGRNRIEIALGSSPDSHITHTIENPLSISLKQTEEGADEALEITAAETTTLLRFRSAVRTELVDGL